MHHHIQHASSHPHMHHHIHTCTITSTHAPSHPHMHHHIHTCTITSNMHHHIKHAPSHQTCTITSTHAPSHPHMHHHIKHAPSHPHMHHHIHTCTITSTHAPSHMQTCKAGGNVCFYGVCLYCKPSEAACADGDLMEGSVTIWLPAWYELVTRRHPYQRTYIEGMKARQVTPCVRHMNL